MGMLSLLDAFGYLAWKQKPDECTLQACILDVMSNYFDKYMSSTSVCMFWKI